MGDVTAKAGGTIYLKSGKIETKGGKVKFIAKRIVVDTSLDTINKETKYQSNRFGSLLSKEKKEQVAIAKNNSTLINAKDIEFISADGVVLKGAKLQSDAINILTSKLLLVSAKDADFKSSFSDGSGILVRTIINSGHNKETAVATELNATKLMLNGKSLLNKKLSKEGVFQTISSENPNLTNSQLEIIKAQLNNKDWYDKTKTLSKLGSLIVQAVVSYFTAGVGSGLISTGVDGVVQAAVDTAVNSMIQQVATQTLTAAITGNPLN